MLLTPKRWKFRKRHVKPLKGKSVRWSYISFWEYWLKATTSWYLTNKQLEAARKVVIRHIKKVWQLWFRVFPDVPLTKKWLEMPMGTWKWDVDIYAAAVRKWRIILELTWLPADQAMKVLTSAWKKLPIKTRVILKWEIR